MVEGPTTTALLITQLILSDSSNPNDWDVKLDTVVITNFKSNTSHCRNVFFREEVVEDEEQMVKIIRSIHTSSDLILVGRRHTMESQIMAGIGEWSEYPELGVIGDILASSDTDGQFSVLVLQHHADQRAVVGSWNHTSDTAAEATGEDGEVEVRLSPPVIGEEHTILEAIKTLDFWIL
uniref:Uncharacterized protein n=1 Tax=Nelumbo nucifera TaxID=4432 RepID=A0A822YM03_NELNU|nr:TPA_asm: hypothetical protein HUJ06_011462 [Nelumbo nucifera]